MRLLRNGWLLLVIRLIVGGFFVYASMDKIVHPDAFAKIVHNYRLLPGVSINLLALILPWLELLCGIALVLGTRVSGASAIITGLMVVFIIAVTSAMARGIKIDCGCFTTSSEGARKVGMRVLYEDAALLILAVIVWIQGAGHWALERNRR